MIVLFMLLFAALPGNAAAQTLDELLARMDQNAMSFKSMSAKLRYMSYVAVIKEGTVSTGTLTMKRSRREAMVLVDFTEPDPKTVAVAGTKVAIYLPKLQTVEEYDLGKSVERHNRRRGSLADWSHGASSRPGFLAGRKDDCDRKSRWND